VSKQGIFQSCNPRTVFGFVCGDDGGFDGDVISKCGTVAFQVSDLVFKLANMVGSPL
jgi:hypothetical protein